MVGNKSTRETVMNCRYGRTWAKRKKEKELEGITKQLIPKQQRQWRRRSHPYRKGRAGQLLQRPNVQCCCHPGQSHLLPGCCHCRHCCQPHSLLVVQSPVHWRQKQRERHRHHVRYHRQGFHLAPWPQPMFECPFVPHRGPFLYP